MRFIIHPAELLDDWPELYRAYISGFDGRVFPTRVEVSGNVVACRRHQADSGKLHVAVPVPGIGRPMVTTSSLPEREEPFLLAVELARGKLSSLREQVASWQMSGMTVPAEFDAVYREAHQLLARSTASQDEPEQASRSALDALACACRAADMLARAYVDQRLSVRRRRSTRLPASLGCSLGDMIPSADGEDYFCGAFNAALVPIEWRAVEPREGEYHWEQNDAQVAWCLENKLLMVGGPLLDLSPEGLPDWLATWEHDFLNMQSFVCDFVETAIARYVGLIRHWEVSARVNTGGALALNEENRLTLAARTLEVARQVDDEIQLLIRVEQPWGEYQARGQHRLSPLQFVDALLRSGIALSAVNLEIAVGYRPRGSSQRDLLDFSRLLDLWSCLGIPLHVTLAFPSAVEADPGSKPDLEVDDIGKDLWSEEAQAAFVDLYLPMLMSKQPVVGIYWTHFSDAAPHEFPHAGLVRPDGSPKPALDHILRYRREYWKRDDESTLEF
ncbi:MAG TPA: endo-1,4-beta-xylanase [Planctomycetaceae bacterium]|nr:endo-1,4-beta-xylanase [Planctomycetaceae bacterium]